MSRTWHVYLLRCVDGTLYCGVSNDLPRRILRHNSGKGAKYTRGRLPVRMVWWSICKSKGDAMLRERTIKGFSKSVKERLVKSMLNF
jgi:predicted GIY-YIG superfamily endonuclease